MIVNGGQYNFCSFADTNEGALYDPVSNTWTAVSPPTGWSNIGDVASVVPTEKVYQLADCCSGDMALATIRGSTVTWTVLTGAHTGKDDGNGGEGWTTLPDQRILTIDTTNCVHDKTSCTELLDIGSNTWSDGERTCGQLIAPGDPAHDGPNALLPNGFVFAAGATGTNCIMDTASGHWYPAPGFGSDLDAPSAPAAVLPSGNLLIQVSPGAFGTPSHFFEIKVKNATTVTATEVDAPASASGVSSFDGRMLVLPTGQVLWTNDAGDVEIYTAKGAPKDSWRPVIKRVSPLLSIGSKNNPISGKNFNGFTFGGYYGSAAQTASNYPLVRITNAASGHVCYARTHDHNRMGIADGTKSSTRFDVPRACEKGDGMLEVIANGIASAAVPVTLQ